MNYSIIIVPTSYANGLEMNKFNLDLKVIVTLKYTPVNSGDEKTLRCNHFDDGVTQGLLAKPLYSKLFLFSNWSIATEIKRLIDINSVVKKEYN